VNAYSAKRCKISEGAFQNSFISQLFSLSHRAVNILEAKAPHDLQVRLLFLDAWGRLFIQGNTQGDVAKVIRNQISID
jgi:hypothetical protein